MLKMFLIIFYQKLETQNHIISCDYII